MKYTAVALILLSPTFASAQVPTVECPTTDCVPSGGRCLSSDQLNRVKKALEELDGIHQAKATVEVQDTVTIISDWDGRVYVNGGETNPVRMKLKLGDTIDRDMAIVLPTQVYYRPKPPDPMFRLRIRAQAGLLIPGALKRLKGESSSFADAGIGWDFFHLGSFNVSGYTGVASLGAGFGLDLTKNFGPYVGYALVYDGLQSSILGGVYFSFN